MERSLEDPLEVLALPLAGIVVAIHLWWGIQRFVRRYLMEGVLIDPRPVLFVLSSLVIVAGIAFVYLGGPRRPVYVAGIGLMVAYVSGYFWWHAAGHRAILPWVETGAGSGHSHEITFAELLVDHVQTDPIAMTSKAAETVLIAVLSVLLYLDVRRESSGSTTTESNQ